MKVLMLVLNTFENDSRVHRCAKTLVEAGNEVTLLCLHKEGLPKFQSCFGYSVIREDLLSQGSTTETIRKRIESLKETKPILYRLCIALYLPAFFMRLVLKEIFALAKQSLKFCRYLTEQVITAAMPLIRLKPFAPIRSLYWQVNPKRQYGRLVHAVTEKRETAPSLPLKLLRFGYGSCKSLNKTKRQKLLLRLLRSPLSILAKFSPISAAEISFEKRKLQYDLFAQAALELAERYKPDVVHAHDFNTLIAAHKIWERNATPYIYDSHELWTHRNRPNVIPCEAEKKWEEELEGRYIKDATFSITVCDSIAEHLANQYKVETPVVIRNTPYRKKVERDETKSLRRDFNISNDDFLAVYVGIVSFNRGLTDILNALPLLDSKVKFVTLGAFHPAFRAVFDNLVEELGLLGRVFCHDPVAPEEVSTWLADVDVSLTTMNRVCLSYVYTLPNKLFESVQGGVPIIGPDSPEIIRIVDKYNCGMVYRDKDSRHLAEQISLLMNDSQLLNTFRAGARAAGEALCWENEKEMLLKSYDKFFQNEFSENSQLVTEKIKQAIA